jgi:hypothetical protein
MYSFDVLSPFLTRRYDVTCSNWNDNYANKLDRSKLPDMVRNSINKILHTSLKYPCMSNSDAAEGYVLMTQVLVKKSYKDKRKRHGKRAWKLQHMPKEEENISKREEETIQCVVFRS